MTDHPATTEAHLAPGSENGRRRGRPTPQAIQAGAFQVSRLEVASALRIARRGRRGRTDRAGV